MPPTATSAYSRRRSTYLIAAIAMALLAMCAFATSAPSAHVV